MNARDVERKEAKNPGAQSEEKDDVHDHDHGSHGDDQPSNQATRSLSQRSAASVPPLGGERHGASAAEGLRESREHREVGVKLDTREAANAERRKAVVVLQPSELALDSGATAIERGDAFAVAHDAREQPTAHRLSHSLARHG